MSLYQLVEYPKYVVCLNTKKLYSLSTGKLNEMVPESKTTRSFSLNKVVNGQRKKVFMTFDKIERMVPTFLPQKSKRPFAKAMLLKADINCYLHHTTTTCMTRSIKNYILYIETIFIL